MLHAFAPAIADCLEGLAARLRDGKVVPVGFSAEEGEGGAFVLGLRLVPGAAPIVDDEPAQAAPAPTAAGLVCPRCKGKGSDVGRPKAGEAREALCLSCGNVWRVDAQEG